MSKPKAKPLTNPIAKPLPKMYSTLPQLLELIRVSDYKSKK
jgi:hypothetical protein